jgi:hypothetical protein
VVSIRERFATTFQSWAGRGAGTVTADTVQVKKVAGRRKWLKLGF